MASLQRSSFDFRYKVTAQYENEVRSPYINPQSDHLLNDSIHLYNSYLGGSLVNSMRKMGTSLISLQPIPKASSSIFTTHQQNSSALSYLVLIFLLSIFIYVDEISFSFFIETKCIKYHLPIRGIFQILGENIAYQSLLSQPPCKL